MVVEVGREVVGVAEHDGVGPETTVAGVANTGEG